VPSSGESTPQPPEPTFRDRLFEGTAADYDRFRLPYADALVALVRAELALDGTGMLVDLGAGTGQVARAFRRFFEHVVAVDPEPDMVEFGRARTERENDTIEWRLARAEDVEFPHGGVEVVASGNAFHRFDRPVVVANAARWLAADSAIILLWSSGPLQGTEQWQVAVSRLVNEWLDRSGARARIPAGWERKEYTDEIVLRDAGFDRQAEHTMAVRHEWTVETIIGFLHATSFASRAALQGQVDAFDADVRDVLLGVDSSGIFRQDVPFGARFARR
jgi:SAM-dependent methyltransferase